MSGDRRRPTLKLPTSVGGQETKEPTGSPSPTAPSISSGQSRPPQSLPNGQVGGFLKSAFDEYEGWLRRDDRGRFIMGYRAKKHAGQMMLGVPSGYIRNLLKLRGLPPAVQVALRQAIHQFDSNPDPESGDWVPFLIGDVTGWVHKDVYESFLEEYRRISRIVTNDKLSPVLDAIIANSSSTPTESLL